MVHVPIDFEIGYKAWRLNRLAH